MCIKCIFLVFTLFSSFSNQVVESGGFPDYGYDQYALQLTKSYIDVDRRLCVHAMWRSKRNHLMMCRLLTFERNMFDGAGFGDIETIFSICSHNFDDFGLNHISLECYADIIQGKLPEIPVYFKDLKPTVLNRSFSYVNGIPVYNFTLISNPFFLMWEIGNTILLAGETKENVTAFEQKLIGNFTYSVALQFSNLQKKHLNYNYTMILNYTSMSFNGPFSLLDVGKNIHFQNDLRQTINKVMLPSRYNYNLSVNTYSSTHKKLHKTKFTNSNSSNYFNQSIITSTTEKNITSTAGSITTSTNDSTTTSTNDSTTTSTNDSTTTSTNDSTTTSTNELTTWLFTNPTETSITRLYESSIETTVHEPSTESLNQSIKRSINESVSETSAFQLSTFFCGVIAGLAVAALAYAVLRALCRAPPPRLRLPTPPPEPEYYSEIYSWRRPINRSEEN